MARGARVKLAFLTTDNRQATRQYDKAEPWFGTAPEALLQGFAQIPDLEVHVVTCTQQPMSSPAKLARNIYFHSLHVPKRGWMRTLYQGCIRATRRKLREIVPDVVHGQGTERDCAISAVLSGFPNVLTIHGNMRAMARLGHAPPLSFYWLAAKLESFVLRKTNGVVCITNYTRAAVEPLNGKTWLVPNPVDAAFFELRPVPAAPPVILCVGNISPRKNQNALIECLDHLPKPEPRRVVFLGTQSNDAYSRQFSRLVEARSWCEYGGFAGRETLKSWLKQSSLLILPSLEDNCPMVILEAMAAGVPVAAARVGGIPDLIRDGENGFLFDPTSGSEMSRAASRALETTLDGEMAPRARQEAHQRFHPSVIAQKHMEIYGEVLGRVPRCSTPALIAGD